MFCPNHIKHGRQLAYWNLVGSEFEQYEKAQQLYERALLGMEKVWVTNKARSSEADVIPMENT